MQENNCLKLPQMSINTGVENINNILIEIEFWLPDAS